MRFARFLLAVVMSVASANAFGATFIVPSDKEMVTKSAAIVTGTVEGSYVKRGESTIETVYEIRVDRAMKGNAARHGELLRIVSPGGVLGDEGVLVPGAAHFLNGDRVLLFLTNDGGKWQTTDLTLGKFRFKTSSKGEHLLVRDAQDIHGWDENGAVHREPVRREEGFLRFIEQRAAGAKPKADYLVDAAAVELAPEPDATTTQFGGVSANATGYAPKTYTDNVSDGTTYRGIRWPNISAGVVFYKRADQNIAGASDGGVSVIQGGLAAWNNECGSNINLQYGGTTSTASKNFDTVHVVEFNDPQSRISGSWTGSGTIATTFLSFGSSHTFANDTWWTMTDADVVFQNGYAATNASFAPAMTHELGHGIGWRHSNSHYIRNADYTDGTCNSTVEECTTAAIMNAVVNSSYGYTLQPWDVHAAQAVYPGGTCSTCTPPSITSQPKSATITSGSSVTLTVTATGTAPSYQWYTGSSGDTSKPIAGATSSTLTVKPASTTSYWVRVTNSCGTANSATATVTVSASTPPPNGRDVFMDFNGDGKSEMIWRNTSTGQFAMWEMNGRTLLNGAVFRTLTDNNWKVLGFGDFDGDGDDDFFFRNASTGGTAVWLMNGRTVTLDAPSTSVPDMNWQMHAIGDFNGDGKDELIWRNTANGQVAMWEMNGATLVNGGAFYTVSDLNWQIQLAGDFTGDGKDEILWRNMATGQVAMWEMNGRTLINGASFGPVAGLVWSVAAVGDFNGDGKDDLLWRNTSTGNVAMWEMNGRTVLNDAAIRVVPLEWQIERCGDFNADGKDEIIWWNRNTGDVAMWEVSGHRVVGDSVISRLPSLSWRMQPRGGARPSLTAQ